jgi:hypothetical protein
MMPRTELTIGQIARELREPEWKIRRIVDAIDSELPRVGQYRMIPQHMLPAIRDALETKRPRKACRRESRV